MGEIRLQVDLDTLTLDDLIALEGAANARTLRDVLAKQVVDEAGQRMPMEEAQAALGKLPLRRVIGLGKDFAAAVKGLSEQAAPPLTGKS